MPGTPTSGPADYPAGTARRDRQIASGTRNSACSRSMRDLLPSSIASWILRLNKIRTNLVLYSTLAAPKILSPRQCSN